MTAGGLSSEGGAGGGGGGGGGAGKLESVGATVFSVGWLLGADVLGVTLGAWSVPESEPRSTNGMIAKITATARTASRTSNPRLVRYHGCGADLNVSVLAGEPERRSTNVSA